jgi:hypothetical protein
LVGVISAEHQAIHPSKGRQTPLPGNINIGPAVDWQLEIGFVPGKVLIQGLPFQAGNGTSPLFRSFFSPSLLTKAPAVVKTN